MGNLRSLERNLQFVLTFCRDNLCSFQTILDSDILHVDAAGTSIIIVNSHQVATELFEKRSAIYSSRFVDPFCLYHWYRLFTVPRQNLVHHGQ